MTVTPGGSTSQIIDETFSGHSIMTNSDRFSLEGKIALCIGGTSGIGGAITLGFAEAGATVLPASRRKEKADETAS